MRYFLLVLGVFLIFIDGKAQYFPAAPLPDSVQNNVALLAKHLTKKAINDYEKASLLFRWVALNIKYDDAASGVGKRRINKTTIDVLERREAVCLGYAQLFVEMCEHVDLQSVVIDGYSKQQGKIRELEEVDHAWSAVYIAKKWVLQDVTWASGSKDFEQYFCPSPIDFVKQHLPADPMWQLLKQPVHVLEFKAGVIPSQKEENAFAFADSIQAFFQLPLAKQRLKSYQNTLLFNPTASNKEQLGQAHCDYALSMNETVEHLQKNDVLDSLFLMQEKMISHFRIAISLYPLIDWQQENFANTLINQGVVVSRKLSKQSSQTAIKKVLAEMKKYLLEAKTLLQTMKNSLFSMQTLQACEEYLLWVEKY